MLTNLKMSSSFFSFFSFETLSFLNLIRVVLDIILAKITIYNIKVRDLILEHFFNGLWLQDFHTGSRRSTIIQ